jgi:hypothetical protein
VPGFDWRGRVTDRAGRSGVAISYDSAEPGLLVRWALVFAPDTGELLASESMNLAAGQEHMNAYTLYLATGWTDHPGTEPTG